MSGMYDLSTMTYSPEGKIFQLEYATKCVDNSETIIGVRCKDGVILGAEKLLMSKLLVPGTNQRVYNVDQSIGMAITGRLPDGKNMLTRARQEVQNYKKNYGISMPGNILAERVGSYAHVFTQYWSYRPFGSTAIISSYDEDGFHLNMIEPSGLCYGYYACAMGKGKQIAKAEFEKRDFKNLSCQEALIYVAKILNLCHEEFKDKKFELEISWICAQSNFTHQFIPSQLRDEADRLSLEEIEKEQQE